MTTTTDHLTCADTSKLLRTALRQSFPGITFRVRSHTYSMGASIHVTWTDGPFQSDVQAVCDLYKGATFDSSRDLTEYRDTLLAAADGSVRTVHFGADFIHTTRKLSDTYRKQLCALASKRLRRDINGDGSQYLPEADCYDNQYIWQLSQEVAA